MKNEELTHKIIGAAMEVHKHLGNGFQEVVYQRALAIEMNMRKINFSRELNHSGGLESQQSQSIDLSNHPCSYFQQWHLH